MLTARNKERAAARQQAKGPAVAMAGYDPVTALAARECKVLYHNHGDGQYSLCERTQLGKAAVDPGVSILTGGNGERLQTRANGRALADLPRYTS